MSLIVGCTLILVTVVVVGCGLGLGLRFDCRHWRPPPLGAGILSVVVIGDPAACELQHLGVDSGTGRLETAVRGCLGFLFCASTLFLLFSSLLSRARER